jgi:hypothetical protein
MHASEHSSGPHFGSTAAYLVSVEHPCHVPNCMTETEAHTKGSQDSLLRHGILKPNFLDKKRLGTLCLLCLLCLISSLSLEGVI